MTDDELRQAAETIVHLPPPEGRIADGSVAELIRWLRTLAGGVIVLLEERDTWKERAEALLDEETTPPHVWKAQKAVIEAARNVVKDSGDLRELEDPVRVLEDAERDT